MERRQQGTARHRRPARGPAPVTAGLLVAFVVLPPLLRGGPGGGIVTREADIAEAAGAGFVEQWRTGAAAPPSALAHLVDYWTTFHLLKAVIAGLLVWTCVKGVRASVGRVARAGFAATSAFAVLALIANVQGAVAPLASLASMLPRGRDGALPEALRTMRRFLLGSPDTGWPPPLRSLVTDFAAYHWALAGVGTVVVAGLLILVATAWRRSARFTAALCGVGALALMVIVAANLSTARVPAPALADFLAAWT